MRIYVLTPDGKKAARSVNSPDTPAWRVIHFLDRAGQSSDERISQYTGLAVGDLAVVIRRLKYNRPPIVSEIGE